MQDLSLAAYELPQLQALNLQSNNLISLEFSKSYPNLLQLNLSSIWYNLGDNQLNELTLSSAVMPRLKSVDICTRFGLCSSQFNSIAEV